MLKIKFVILLSLFLCSGCKDSVSSNKICPLTFEQAKEIAVQCLFKSGYYMPGEFEILYDPNNIFWNEYSSPYPKMLEDYGLKDKQYYAVIFSLKKGRGEGVTVFIDKKKKQIIGILYGTEYEKL